MSEHESEPPVLPSRRELFKAAPAAIAAVTADAAPTPEKPNIVVIFSDQFRWDCIGASGLNPMGLTPNLDAMASRGTIFSSAICAQPVCAPARASILTGQYLGTAP